jgi:hypothetical protein
VPLEIIEPYGREDCVLTRKVGDIQYPLLYSNDKLTGVYEFERKVFDALFAVEMRGIPADEKAYRHLELEVIKNVEKPVRPLRRSRSGGQRGSLPQGAQERARQTGRLQPAVLSAGARCALRARG